MATAGSVVVDLLMKTGSFTTDAARAEKSLQNLQKTASSAATGIGKAFGTALPSISATEGCWRSPASARHMARCEA